ncbi:hypothetical protein [Legionella oakridgensis]|uniref:Uncharacterized protein n=2 Tax=Legionella oakridgensis TaxID=29423 RepID=W0BDK2_9GAMM|nr:hypothetical protein [Legionella oakridgensis]AHE66489.1 hypothetical protein Loa_00930 [Legionella oakridgensis ATCC 33761 = DSM 21215]ETO93758.1 hypothetical protein LOR_73c21040 [Legionella oakridgensis RV-2-2007]KTD43941.1 hypothetical protein Loak_0491 [Legionella oakridgensis]STY19654.1 Uncharacterised protein [Legionella longbeachae]
MSLFDEMVIESEAWYRKAGIKTIKKAPPREGDYFYELKHFLGPNGEVTFLDRFQSFSDFQNDVKSIIIKPLTCLFLYKYHAIRSLYHLGLAAVHLVTLSPCVALDHFLQCGESFIKSFAYDLMVLGTFLLEAISFASRCAITVGYGIGVAAVATGNAVSSAATCIAGFFHANSSKKEATLRHDEEELGMERERTCCAM